MTAPHPYLADLDRREYVVLFNSLSEFCEHCEFQTIQVRMVVRITELEEQFQDIGVFRKQDDTVLIYQQTPVPQPHHQILSVQFEQDAIA